MRKARKLLWFGTVLILWGVVTGAQAGWVDMAGEWRVSTDAQGFVPFPPSPWSAASIRITGDLNGWGVPVRELTAHTDGTLSLVGGQVFGGTVGGVPGFLYADEQSDLVLNPQIGKVSGTIHYRRGFDGLHGVHGTVVYEGEGGHGMWTGRFHVPWKTR